jgi:hypothetical protein
MHENAPDAGWAEPGENERDDDRIDPREAARMRRRDHDAAGERRALMRPGMGKVFKQILDRQAREIDDLPSDHHRQRHRA